MKYLLQKYEDDTYGYKWIDNLEFEHGRILYEQSENESRQEFIEKNHLEFKPKEYGSDYHMDRKVLSQNGVDQHTYTVPLAVEAAQNQYALDHLVKHPDWQVRVAVAKQGYGLDILVNDTNRWVRQAVAKQKYGLDVLVHDDDWYVRKTVAKQNYGLDILIKDNEWGVRKAVAEQGYGLETLANDLDADVRKAVLENRR